MKKVKYKRLTFNQFKQICLEDIIDWRKILSKSEGMESKKELEVVLKDIKKEFKSVTTYDEIREIYGYFGFDEFNILEILVKLK